MSKDAKIRLLALDKMSKTLQKVGKNFKKIKRDTDKLNNSFKKIKMSTQGFRDSLNRVGNKSIRTGKSLTTSVTAPIGLMGAAIVRTAVLFDASMNKVEAKTKFAGKSIQDLREQAKELGATTKFSASEAAEGMNFLAQAGFDSDQIFKAIAPTLDLAAASGIGLAEASDIASNVMGQFQIEAGEMTRVADVLAKTTAASNTDMLQLADAMKMAGPVAKDFGLSLEDTATAVGILSNAGVQATLAGTGLRKVLLNISAPASEGRKVLEAMGISVADASGNMRGFSDIMTDFGNKANSLDQKTKLEALNKLFGKTGITSASLLLKSFNKNAKTGKTGFQEMAEAVNNTTKSAKTMATVMQKGSVGAFTNLKSATEGLMIAIAESGLLDAVADIAVKITDVFRSLSKTNPELLKIGVIVAAVAAALGPALLIFGAMAKGFAALVFMGGALLKVFLAVKVIAGVIAGALSLPVLAFLALGAAITTIIFKWEKLAAAFKSGKGFWDTAMKLGGAVFSFGDDTAAKGANTNAGKINQQQAGTTNTNNAQANISFDNLPANAKVSTQGFGSVGFQNSNLGFQN